METPNCAICNAPGIPECPCEAERLKIAVEQAQRRALDSRLAEIRNWVIDNAREAVLVRHRQMTKNRKQAHAAYISSLPFYDIYAQYSGHPPLHPVALQQLQTQIRDAHAELKRGIDADWRASIQKYPEILDYYFSLVELRLPSQPVGAMTPPGFGAGDIFGSPPQRKKKRRDPNVMAPAPRIGRAFDEQSYVVTGHKGLPPAPQPPVYGSQPFY